MNTRSDPRGYYAALGLPLTAEPEDIRRAFGERAKQLHPDHAGGDSDPVAFQQVLDAYEVLRDPSRRLRYDADSVQMSRNDPSEFVEPPAPDPLARGWLQGRFWRTNRAPGSRGLPSYMMMARMIGLCGLVLVGVGWGCSQQSELAEQGVRVSQLTVDLERARSGQAEARARYRAASVVSLDQALADDTSGVPAHVFSADLAFPADSADLDPALNTQLLEAIERVAAVVAEIPVERQWLVLIEGQAPRAASDSGVEVAGWQLSLLRISQIVDRLVQAGLPPDRVAMRFSAGFAQDAVGSDPARTVELRVVCCLR